MKRQSYPVTNIGSVSLLMTFIVLCLAIFATLSLSGALSEYHYSQKIAQHNQEYYEASNEATQLLREIDRILHAAYANGSGSFYTASEELLTGLGGISMDFSLEQPTIAYEVSINDTQALKVILTLNRPDQTASGYYKISTWQEIHSTTWEGDDSLNLMNYQ